jgi:hypothetical protein
MKKISLNNRGIFVSKNIIATKSCLQENVSIPNLRIRIDYTIWCNRSNGTQNSSHTQKLYNTYKTASWRDFHFTFTKQLILFSERITIQTTSEFSWNQEGSIATCDYKFRNKSRDADRAVACHKFVSFEVHAPGYSLCSAILGSIRNCWSWS